MKKDVIYIDVEDDITSIIEKLKKADSNIVALVPPRRLGVLQSVVNLKLIKRAADGVNKHVVLISADQALTSLTAGIGIPVARDLQSRPALVPANNFSKSDPDEVIEDSMPRPVSAADNAEKVAAGAAATKAIDDADKKKTSVPLQPTRPARKPSGQSLDETLSADQLAADSDAAGKKKKGGEKSGKKLKIPNFEKFRKRLIIILPILILLVGFFIWATKYAPKATVLVSAQASAKQASFNVNLSSSSTNASNDQIQTITRQDQTTLSTTFTPTGTQTTGTNATGTITIDNCDFAQGFTLSSGSTFTASNSNLTFVSTQSVTVPPFKGQATACMAAYQASNGQSSAASPWGMATVPVQAQAIGSQYNIDAQAYSIPGVTDPAVWANGTAMTGGNSQQVTVVSQADVTKAEQSLMSQSTTTVQNQLKQEFDSNTWVFGNTLLTKDGTVASQPAVGQQGTSATLTIPVTYTMIGISKSDINAVLNNYFQGQISNAGQQSVYSNGMNGLTISMEQKPTASDPSTATVQFSTTGYIGPKINISQLTQEIVGDKTASVQQTIGVLPNVKSVTVHFSPFWVDTIPKASRTTVKLEVANAQ